jgi:hypothetical protein
MEKMRRFTESFQLIVLELWFCNSQGNRFHNMDPAWTIQSAPRIDNGL